MNIKLDSGKKIDVVVRIVDTKTVKKASDYKALKTLGFSASQDEICFLNNENILYVGIEAQECDLYRSSMAAVIRTLKKFKFSTAIVDQYDEDNNNGFFAAIVEGATLGDYTFDKYKSKKEKTSFKTLYISLANSNKKLLSQCLENAQIKALATNFTRELVNTTPEDLYPLAFAKIAQKIAVENSLSCKILDEKMMKKENMNALLAVGRASRHESKLIHLTYKPKNAKKRIALVGKGLTYDSGGLSLKPAASMVSMKLDKSGGCAVLGIIKAISELKLDIEVHAVIGAVENMIGGDAYKPDDVLTARNGKTIEVRNTDAEGRLVLADCLCYAQDKIKPDYIFDYATLTGACVVALGHYTTGIMGHSSKLKHEIAKAASTSGELVGSLPFNRHLKKLLKSNVADMSNISSQPYGGAITAALFLDNFIEEEYKEKWIHFDIAGPAYVESQWGYNPAGGSGAGVRMTIEWLEALK